MESDGLVAQSRGAQLMEASKIAYGKALASVYEGLGESRGLWLELLASETGEGTEVMCPEGMGNG